MLSSEYWTSETWNSFENSTGMDPAHDETPPSNSTGISIEPQNNQLRNPSFDCFLFSTLPYLGTFQMKLILSTIWCCFENNSVASSCCFLIACLFFFLCTILQYMFLFVCFFIIGCQLNSLVDSFANLFNQVFFISLF